MESPLELFVLSWGLYPRRVLIYLSEKGLLSSPLIKITNVKITVKGVEGPENTPKGSFPVLRLPNGDLIRQSIAILDYFEDICEKPDPKQDWQKKLGESARNKTMRGETAEQRARTRDILSLADEMTSQFSFACHKGSRLFVGMETTSPVTAKLALESCTKNLKLLAKYYEAGAEPGKDREISIADCVLMSTLQFAYDLYGMNLLIGQELSPLQGFYEMFGQREFMRERVEYPEPIKALAPQWLPWEETTDV